MNKKGVPHSFSLSIDANHAVLSYDKFAKLSGISKASQGEKWRDWSKPDKAIWQSKLRKQVGHNFYISINYLAGENSFFVRPQKESPYISDMQDKERIYQATIAGEFMSEEVQLRIYSRVIDKQAWFLTVALYWTNGEINDQKEDFVILCDFPLFAARTDENLKKLGFEIKEYDSVDGYTDEFGDYAYYSSLSNYSKNGVSITLR